jgi:hypothetical protein
MHLQLIFNHSWLTQQSFPAITRRHLAAKQEKLGEEMATEFCVRSISLILAGFFNMP